MGLLGYTSGRFGNQLDHAYSQWKENGKRCADGSKKLPAMAKLYADTAALKKQASGVGQGRVKKKETPHHRQPEDGAWGATTGMIAML